MTKTDDVERLRKWVLPQLAPAYADLLTDILDRLETAEAELHRLRDVVSEDDVALIDRALALIDSQATEIARATTRVPRYGVWRCCCCGAFFAEGDSCPTEGCPDNSADGATPTELLEAWEALAVPLDRLEAAEQSLKRADELIAEIDRREDDILSSVLIYSDRYRSTRATPADGPSGEQG